MSTAINTTRAYTSYEVVSMHDLNEGDIITSHGGMFRLINRHVSEAHDSNGLGGECIVFDGVFLGDSFSDTDCGIPAHWRENTERTSHRGGGDHGYWAVQGNRLAKQCRITNTSLQYFHGRDDSGVGVWKHEPKS